MENNNEVERARAWFEQLEPHEWSAVCKRVFGYVDFVLSTEKLLQAHNAEHPESKEPQKQQGCPFDEEAFNPDSVSEQTYSIEEAAKNFLDVNSIQDVNIGDMHGLGNDWDLSCLLAEFHNYAIKLSQIKDSKNK